MKNRLHNLEMSIARDMHSGLTSKVHPLALPLAADEQTGWKPYPIFKGSCANLFRLSCHASALAKDCSPHAPHTHDTEEELLIMLAGEADLILPQLPEGRVRLSAGQFVYYPRNYPHTLQTVSETPANYMMFKWFTQTSDSQPATAQREKRGVLAKVRGLKRPRDGETKANQRVRPLEYGHYSIGTPAVKPDGRLGWELMFKGPTELLRKLHCHVSTLAPGGGYEPHRDSHDVAIVLLEGELQTLGERVVPHGVIFYRGGEPHGMHNPGLTTARYVVFEFHGSHIVKTNPFLRHAISVARALTPKPWRGRVKRMVRRVLPLSLTA